jgi:hypothetical protein
VEDLIQPPMRYQILRRSQILHHKAAANGVKGMRGEQTDGAPTGRAARAPRSRPWAPGARRSGREGGLRLVLCTALAMNPMRRPRGTGTA